MAAPIVGLLDDAVQRHAQEGADLPRLGDFQWERSAERLRSLYDDLLLPGESP